MGFVQADSDPCIYRASAGETFFIGVYVDDIVLAAKSEKQLSEVKKSLAERFNIKDMGRLHYFLGMKVIQNDETNEVWIGHPAYTKNLLQKFGMESAKPVKTPVDTSTKLVKAILKVKTALISNCISLQLAVFFICRWELDLI